MIYFVESSDGLRVKIGTTIRLSVRIKQLRAKYGEGLKIVAVTEGSFVEESKLHAGFADLRLEGEWFLFESPIRDFVRDHADAWDGTDEVPLVYMPGVSIDPEVHERATKAASLMGMSLADYASAVLRKAADRDLLREAKKITGEGEK